MPASASGPPVTGQVTNAAGVGTIPNPAGADLTTRRQPTALVITALAANVGKVYVGPVGVTTANGDELAAGGKITLDTSDPAAFAVAGTNGDKISYLILFT